MHKTIRMYREDNHLIIHLPYSPERVKKMRTIPNRKWDNKRKVWIVGRTSVIKLQLKNAFRIEKRISLRYP